MSFFSTKQTVFNQSTLPKGTTVEQALVILHDHDFMIKCDPHYVKHSKGAQPAKTANTATDEAAARKAFNLPDFSADAARLGAILGGASEADPYVKVYNVVDEMPNPVFSSTINSKLEYVDLERALWTRVNSPMGVVLETTWMVVEAADGSGSLELHQEIVISCNKMLVGTVKSTIEANRGGIHKLIKARLEKELGIAATPAADAPAPAPAGAAAEVAA